MRLFQIALFCLLVFLQHRLWMGHNGVKDYTSVKKAAESHQKLNEKLLKRNKLLKADIDDLKLGLEGVEERARNELGMIKEHETFIRVLPKRNHEKKY